MQDKPIRFYDDDGTEVNPDLISKPSLCASCVKDDDPSEEPICAYYRLDQQGEEEFRCDIYVSKAGPGED